jgi:glycosyltransferase involved in cell wall biosynthesis
VDDGSTDGTSDVIRGFLADRRIRLFLQEHRGAAAARNRALAESRGDIVAYLDSDDVWYPEFLAAVVRAFEQHPSRDAVYAALLVSSSDPAETFVRGVPFDRERLLKGNFIPMTAFAHRPGLFERCGGFDETLTRLIDWDLILRYTAETEPLQIPIVAGEYRAGSWRRISNEESVAFNGWKIRRKHERLAAARPRVLYALEYAPTLSESYIQAEIACMRRWGVEIELWAERDPPAPCATGVRLHRGTLAGAISSARPDVVHAHHLHRALRYLPEVAGAGLRMTIRGHGVEFDRSRLQELLSSANVESAYVFPQQAEGLCRVDGKLRPMSVAFDPVRYFPAGRKDPRLVVRASLAAPAKGLTTFLRLAARHRFHRFVLFACRSIGYPDHLEELRKLNRSLGDAVDLCVDRPYDEVEAVVREAAIYLHTPTLAEPYGMPISIAEAMATGCLVIARRCPGSAAFVGEAGALYDAEAEASAVLEETVAWPDERWQRAQLASIDRAFDRFASDRVLRPLLEDWAHLALSRADSSLATAAG